MAKFTGMPALLVLALLVALSGARPQTHREVKLITEPQPGQEYVMIQSSVFQPNHEAEFMTSHKIPRKLPVDDPEDLIVKTPKSKIKRESLSSEEDTTADQTLALAPNTPELEAEVPEAPKKVEVRTEFSVVTSKPRKGSKEAKERAIAFAAKEASSGHSVSPTPQVPLPEVNVETKGDTGKLEGTVSGADEKKVMIKKLSAAEHASKAVEHVKEEQTIKEVEVQPSSELGVNSPQVEEEEGVITVPLQKKLATSAPQEVSTALSNHTSQSPSEGFEILPVNILPKTAEKHVKNKDKDFDFVDSALTDKVLVPAGSNQQSRIEVKKGPNGQDYEYEYVYYYYDEDEDDAAGGAGAKKTSVVKATTTPEPTTTSRHYLPKKESDVTHHEKDHGATRTRTRGQSAAVGSSEEKHEAKTRYTAIERPTTTAAPDTANEIIPARGAAASRTRGRTLTTEEPAIAEERLPVNTRFPPRSRSNHNSNSVASTTPLPQDAPAPRVRGSSGANSVRRPSLELVDSSSFKTQSSDASRDQDPRPEFPKTLPAANEEEEVVKPRGRGRGQTSTTPAAPAPVEEEDQDIPSESHSRGQLSRRPDTAIRSRGQIDEDDDDDEVASVPETATDAPTDDGLSLTTVTDVDVGLTAAAMDKAALELYAVLSQARAESNAIDEEVTDEEITTELDDVSTTLEPTTEAPTTTTTTTTTPAPTTTTTTVETPLAAGRGRYRQRGNTGTSGPRNRFRADKGEASASISTTETPAETSTKARARFGSNRVSSSGTRRGFSKSTTPRPDEDAAVEHEATKDEAKPDSATPPHRAGGFPRNRFGATRTARVTTPTSPAAADDATAHVAAAPVKPVFADRFNLKRRGGGIKLHSTPAPAAAAESKAETSAEENDSPSEPSTTASSVRLPGRNRLSVGSGPRPLRPGPRVNISPRGRLGAATTTTTVAPSTEAEDAGSEQTSSASQEEAQSEEAQEIVTTPAPDALTRLRNRPRLRVSAVKPTSAPTPAPIRRPLIPRRKLGHPAEVKESTDSETQDSSDDTPASSEETSESSGDEVASAVTPEPEQPQGLASLVSGRRRGNALRRPRTLLPGSSRVPSQAS